MISLAGSPSHSGSSTSAGDNRERPGEPSLPLARGRCAAGSTHFTSIPPYPFTFNPSFSMIEKVKRILGLGEKEAEQPAAHQRRKTRTPRRPAGRRRARRIHHRARQRPQHRRRHLQGPRQEHRTRPEGDVRGHRLREKRVPPLLGRAAGPGKPRHRTHRARSAQGQHERQPKPPQESRPPRTSPRFTPSAARCSCRSRKVPSAPRVRASRPTSRLAGRYLVFMPYSDQSGISRKIEDPKERDRLRKILRALDIPEGMGVIMRTVGEGQRARFFVRDLSLLLEQWRGIEEAMNAKKAPGLPVRGTGPDRPHGARFPDRRGGQGGVRRRGGGRAHEGAGGPDFQPREEPDRASHRSAGRSSTSTTSSARSTTLSTGRSG